MGDELHASSFLGFRNFYILIERYDWRWETWNDLWECIENYDIKEHSKKNSVFPMIVYCNSQIIMTQICDAILRSPTEEERSHHYRWQIKKVLESGIQLEEVFQGNEAGTAAYPSDNASNSTTLSKLTTPKAKNLRYIWIVTDRMAASLDKSIAACIIHYQLPHFLRDSFIPRMIRAGRKPNSKGGLSIAFVTPEELGTLKQYYEIQLKEFLEFP
jgi:hypothetical protein